MKDKVRKKDEKRKKKRKKQVRGVRESEKGS